MEQVVVEILNMKKQKPIGPFDVRVDRASVLGSPYKLHWERDRDEVIDKYNIYFTEQVETNVEFAKELNRLLTIHSRYGKLRLFCHCKPKKCHADIIKEWLELEIKKRS